MSDAIREGVRFWGFTLGVLALVLAAGISIGTTYQKVGAIEAHMTKMQSEYEVQYELLLRIDERQQHITVYLEEMRREIRREE